MTNPSRSATIVVMAGRARAPGGNLPVELGSFVGRTRELMEIRRLLAVARTATLTGPGGIGKSRLALHVGHQLARHFRDGVWWVELAEVDTPDRVVDALARALAVQEQPDTPLQESLVAHLAEREVLLVLDNCEHLVDACRDLTFVIVSSCADVRVLATSRQRLGVPGEAVVAVSPLRLPGSDERSSVAAVEQVEAVSLLVDRTQARAPDFVLTGENCAAVIDICERLDGLPLAIELAAVRLVALAPSDVLDRLDDRFRLLTSERDRHSHRHQALVATVEWSHDLLTSDEQRLWRRCSVFAGSFGIDAAEVVCAGDGLDQDRVVELIGRLVDQSILTVARGTGRARYRLLETLRLYGQGRLRDAQEEQALRRRHAAWYASLVSRGDSPWWGSPGQLDAVDRFDADWANLEAALDFFDEDDRDAPAGMRMATDLVLYWVFRGRYGVGRRHLESFLSKVTAPSGERAFALWGLGWLAQATGDFDAALHSYEEAYANSRAAGASRQLVWAQVGLGYVALRRGDVETGTGLLAAANEGMPADDATGRALLSFMTTIVLTVAGQPDDGLHHARQALELTAALGESLARIVLNIAAGYAAWRLGDRAAAKSHLEEATRISDRFGYRFGLSMSLEVLGWIATDEGKLELAAALDGARTALDRELGSTPLEAWAPHRTHYADAVRSALSEARWEAWFDDGVALARANAAASLALDEAVDQAVAPATLDAAPERDTFALTAREMEVARMVADGLSNPAIAQALFVSVATVKTHVSHILQKLALDSRVQLASWVAAHAPSPES